MATEARQTVRKYVLASRHYLENGLLMLNSRDAGKASELLWGSVAEALQAVAVSRGTRLANHRSLHWFVGQLGKELNDRSIIDGFFLAEHLHSNFHEVELTVEDVAAVVEPIRNTIAKLFDLIPKELVNEP
ncbi:MAG: PaREP1 family protein [Chloroflexi bacterium]|nr:PaREP1 family protein [Chloroflexota bacterium]